MSLSPYLYGNNWSLDPYGKLGEKTCASQTFLFLGVPLQTYPHPLWVRNLTVMLATTGGGMSRWWRCLWPEKNQKKPMVWNVLIATVSTCWNFCLKQLFSSLRLILQKFLVDQTSTLSGRSARWESEPTNRSARSNGVTCYMALAYLPTICLRCYGKY